MNANKHLLSLALLTTLGSTQAANAQDYDDRWYLTGGIGYNQQDTDRRTKDTLALSLGVGRFLTRAWSLDAELNWQNADFDVRKYSRRAFGNGLVPIWNFRRSASAFFHR